MTLLLDLATFKLSRRTPKGYAYPTLRTAALSEKIVSKLDTFLKYFPYFEKIKGDL
jgi:hypothetical protein